MSDDKEEVSLGDCVELSAHRMGMVKYIGIQKQYITLLILYNIYHVLLF